MLKEFIEHIQKTTQPQVREIEGRSFLLRGEKDPLELEPTLHLPDTLRLNSLDALVQLVATEAARVEELLYITVPDPLTVDCFTHPEASMRGRRQVWYRAFATDVPGWDAKVKMPFEEMQIALRTRFQDSADLPYVQKLLSDISTGAKITFNDNGVATTIVTKKGIDLQSNELIRPIVTLRPYRTFQEVAQPESTFLIRIDERGISFVEADGGMWRLQARKIIKQHLQERLNALDLTDQVIVAL